LIATAGALPTSGQLDLFLDSLRRAQFKIGPDEIAGAHKILLLAHAEADGGLAARRLKTMLAPIVVRTPTQQADFYRRFDALMTGIAPSRTIDPVQEEGRTGDRPVIAARHTSTRGRWRLPVSATVGAALLLTAAVALWLLWPPPPPVPLPSSETPGSSIATVTVPVQQSQFTTATLSRLPGYQAARAGLILLPLLGFAGWIAWRWRRRSLWLERNAGVQDADPAVLRLPETQQPLFPAAELTAIALDLRRHLPVPSRDLDIDRTIPETLNAGGSFTPVWQTLPRSPSYLFLIEKESAHDHVSGILDQAVDRLRTENVEIERYHFRGDPRWVSCDDTSHGIEPIVEIAARYGDHRLVVLTGGDGFFEPLTDRLDTGVEQALTQWAPRAVLSTKPISTWSWRELALIDQGGFNLATASHSGLRALADRAAAEPDRPAEMLEGVVVSMPARPTVARREPQPTASEAPRQGRKSALLICAGREKGADAQILRLAELLERPASGFAVRVLLYPDRQTVIAALETLVHANSGPDDTILVHFNGAVAPGGEGALFLASSQGLEMSAFARLLYQSEAGHQLVVLDGMMHANFDRDAVSRGLAWHGLSQLREVIWAQAAGGSLTGLLADTIEQELPGAEPVTFKRLFDLALRRASRLGILDALRPVYSSGGVAKAGSAVLVIGVQGAGGTAAPDGTARTRVVKDVDVPWCPELVIVPAGRFLMGSPSTEPGRYPNEGPQHEVRVAAFALGRAPITFEEWDACVADGGCDGYRPDDGGWGRGRHPVIRVNWRDAQAYVSWLSQKTAHKYRLPSEAEWEYAARGGTQSAYPWGDSWNNARFANGARSIRGTTEVGSYPPNPFGIYDVIGNVLEWVEDSWHADYVGAPADGSAWIEAEASELGRVVRGGSWDVEPRNLRSAIRGGDRPDVRYLNLGFRVSRTLTLDDLNAMAGSGLEVSALAGSFARA
jgi:formylglycine-generating enzyme required for sulfatase activity